MVYSGPIFKDRSEDKGWWWLFLNITSLREWKLPNVPHDISKYSKKIFPKKFQMWSFAGFALLLLPWVSPQKLGAGTGSGSCRAFPYRVENVSSFSLFLFVIVIVTKIFINIPNFLTELKMWVLILSFFLWLWCKDFHFSPSCCDCDTTICKYSHFPNRVENMSGLSPFLLFWSILTKNMQYLQIFSNNF